MFLTEYGKIDFMNKRLFYFFYNFANENKLAGRLGVLVAKYSQILFMAIYFVGIVLVYNINYGAIFKFILIPFFVLLYNSFLRHKLNMPRPFVKEDIKPLLNHEESGSCPSNHGVSSMIIAIAYSVISPLASFALIILAVITGISRIMVGVHYPLDILVSWVIAAVIGILGFVIL